jgi:hypothetical protein
LNNGISYNHQPTGLGSHCLNINQGRWQPTPSSAANSTQRLSLAGSTASYPQKQKDIIGRHHPKTSSEDLWVCLKMDATSYNEDSF